MFSKCLILLLFLVFVEGQYYYPPSRQTCDHPTLEHGRVRFRQRSKLVKFICLPRYELVGNRYATCRNGEWDVPKPVCVSAGCETFKVDNAVQIRSHHGAWVLTLCVPGYRLVGSAAVYCDAVHWNDTIPSCVEDAASNPALSCDFEDPDICGWIQDELHDFDWIRINLKTPSSFLETGPSYDHTLGIGQNGHYMYIESTSKLENTTARLLSPIYNRSLALDGCFSFFYHMYGSGTGGLRVYQKPDNVEMSDLLKLSDSQKDEYLLWEEWGNQGDFWYSAAPQLKDFNENFQIVVEGIRGRSFTSDIAIDDVAILQGQNCTNFRIAATSPAPPDTDQTCQNRCEDLRSPAIYQGPRCLCHPVCFSNDRCCPDFMEICVFKLNSTDDSDSSTMPEPPQTQKLVVETTTTSTTTPKPTTTSTTTTTTARPTTYSTTRRTNPPTTTSYRPTTTRPASTTRMTTTTKRTTTQKATTRTSTKPTTVKPITPQGTIIPDKISTVPPKVTPTILKTTTKVTYTTKPAPDKKKIEKEEAKKSDKENSLQQVGEKQGEKKSSSLKTAVITIVFLALFAGVAYLVIVARSARGREALARLRGHVSTDTSEVRYLNSNDDDDL